MKRNNLENHSEKNILIIPAISTIEQNQKHPVLKKTAAYARVSTDKDEQFSSFSAQVNYYEKYIKNNPEWKFIGIYSDEGISGTGTKARAGFSSMINDALSGTIDLIITKSISRFARNTIDCLTYTRLLKDHNVEIYFEKENIKTLDATGELLITILSSLAQEESHAISQNVTWGWERSLAKGNVHVPFKSFLGHDRGPAGELVINQDQAFTVKRIYLMYLEGYSIGQIAHHLQDSNVRTCTGRGSWSYSVVKSILTNEKYKGDALLQKTFTKDYLSHKKMKNTGQKTQYYLTDNHPAIIDRDTFDLVQQKISNNINRSSINTDPPCWIELLFNNKSVLSKLLVCGNCGHYLGATKWHKGQKSEKTIWTCTYRYKHHLQCGTYYYEENNLITKLANELVTLSKNKNSVFSYVISNYVDEVFKTDYIEEELTLLKQRVNKQQIDNLHQEYNISPNPQKNQYTI